MTRLVDAEALRKVIQNDLDIGDNVGDDGYYNAMYMSLEYIDNAPTVEITEEQAIDKLHETGWMQRHDKEMTKRPTGEWVHDYDDFYHCSICKRSIITTLTRPTDLFPFCHCGAEMKEAENE